MSLACGKRNMYEVSICQNVLKFVQNQSTRQQLDFIASMENLLRFGLTLYSPNTLHFTDEDNFTLSFVKNRYIDRRGLKIFGRLSDRGGDCLPSIEFYCAVICDETGQVIDRCKNKNGEFIVLSKCTIDSLKISNPFIQKALDNGRSIIDGVLVSSYVKSMAHTDLSQILLYKKHADKYCVGLVDYTVQHLPNVERVEITQDNIHTLSKVIRGYKQAGKDHFIIINFIDGADELSFVQLHYLYNFISHSEYNYSARNIVVIDVDVSQSAHTNETYRYYRNKAPQIWGDDVKSFSVVEFIPLEVSYTKRDKEQRGDILHLASLEYEMIFINCLHHCDRLDEYSFKTQIKKNLSIINHELFCAISCTDSAIGVCFKDLRGKSEIYVEKVLQALKKVAVVVKVSGDSKFHQSVSAECAYSKRIGFPNIITVWVDGTEPEVNIITVGDEHTLTPEEVKDKFIGLIELLYGLYILMPLDGNMTMQDFYAPYELHRLSSIKSICSREESIVV